MTTKSASDVGARAVLQPAQSVFLNWYSAWIVLVVGFLITAVATLYMKSSVEKIADQEFDAHVDEITNKITDRLDDHARILQSGAALFNASDMVTRKKWRIIEEGFDGYVTKPLITRALVAEMKRTLQDLKVMGISGQAMEEIHG